MAATRSRPNILITGTPGTGKTTTAEMAAGETGFTHIDVGRWVKEKELHEGFDGEFQSYILDEDKVCDELEDALADGGCIVDHHSCDFFPERWFDLVVVLQADNGILYDRLEKRGYSDKKVQENVQCEIMQVVAEEARDAYKPEVVVFLKSDSIQDMEGNVERIKQWVEQVQKAK